MNETRVFGTEGRARALCKSQRADHRSRSYHFKMERRKFNRIIGTKKLA